MDLDHDYVGAEHLFLGLVGVEQGLASQVLATFDVTLDRARAATASTLGIELPARPAQKFQAEVTAERIGLGPVHVSVMPGDAGPSDLAALHSAIAGVYRSSSDERAEAQAALTEAIETLQQKGGRVLLRSAPASSEGQG